MVQQVIGVGAAADDRAGDSWRDAMVKSNDNFTELFGIVLDNTVVINELSDFPDPVAGVIELSGGLNVAYEINSASIILGDIRFTITGGSAVFNGQNAFGSSITSIASGDLFTVVNGSFGFDCVQFSCVNARFLNFSGTGFNSIVVERSTILSCTSIATISGCFSTTIRSLTTVDTSVGGIVWTGVGNNQINISNIIGLSWSGTLIDLGTATFNLISISANNRFISPSGTTILSGLASNGNLISTGKALVSNNFFNGLGTALSGITEQDTQYRFIGNSGDIDDSRNLGVSYITVGTNTVNPADNSFVPLQEPTYSQDASSSRVSITSAGVFTVDGEGTNIPLRLEAIITSKRATGSGAEEHNFRWTKSTDGGTIYNDINADSYGIVDNDSRAKQVTTKVFDFADNGDKYRVEWANIGSTATDLTTDGGTFEISDA